MNEKKLAGLLVKELQKSMGPLTHKIPWGKDEWNSFWPGNTDLKDHKDAHFISDKTKFFDSLKELQPFDSLYEIKSHFKKCSPLILAQMMVLQSYRTNNDASNMSNRHVIDMIRLLESERIDPYSAPSVMKYAENLSAFKNADLSKLFHVHTSWFDDTLYNAVKKALTAHYSHKTLS